MKIWVFLTFFLLLVNLSAVENMFLNVQFDPGFNHDLTHNLSNPNLQTSFPNTIPPFIKKLSGKDKVMHFAYSALLTYYSFNFSHDILQKSPSESRNLSICLTSSLGLTKEFYDKYIKNTKFSWYDLGYDLSGVCLGLVVLNNSR